MKHFFTVFLLVLSIVNIIALCFVDKNKKENKEEPPPYKVSVFTVCETGCHYSDYFTAEIDLGGRITRGELKGTVIIKQTNALANSAQHPQAESPNGPTAVR